MFKKFKFINHIDYSRRLLLLLLFIFLFLFFFFDRAALIEKKSLPVTATIAIIEHQNTAAQREILTVPFIKKQMYNDVLFIIFILS